MIEMRSVLTGTDLGPDTEKVLAYASFFAKSMGASLSLLYVIDYLITPPAYLMPYIDEEKKIAEENFRVWKKIIEDIGIKAEMDVVVGRLHESFETEVKRLKTDMLVLGFKTHAFRRSSSERLIKGLQVPMLVVQGKKAEAAKIGSVKIKKILCPTDFSESSMKAVKAAKELQDVLSTELDVIHVLPSHIIGEKMKAWTDKDRARQELTGQAKESLDKFLSEAGLEKAGAIYEGEPHKKIVSVSADNDTDLIVIGARGLSYIKEMLIGSVTDAILKSSPCPVLVIH